MATPAELLAEVEAAISACLTSQAYSAADRSQQRAELAQLTAFRKELLDEINAGSGSMASLAIQTRPT